MSVNVKDICALGKAGKITECLKLAREGYAADSGVWGVRGLGWGLFYAIKAANAAGKKAEAEPLMQEMCGLKIPESDDILFKQQAYVATLLNGRKPANGGSNDNSADDLSVLRKNVAEKPENEFACTRLGWVIYKIIKQRMEEGSTNHGELMALFQEYMKLKAVKKPDLLHSMMLFSLTRFAGDLENVQPLRVLLNGVLSAWPMESLRPEDFVGYKKEIKGVEKELPSLAEKLGKLACELAEGQASAPDVMRAGNLLKQLIVRLPGHAWLEYYEAKILLQTGDRKAARAKMVKIVKMKPTEYWAWDHLAMCMEESELEKRVACLCKALWCRSQDESFLVRIWAEFGEGLAGLGLMAEARWALNRAAELRRGKGWKTEGVDRQISRLGLGNVQPAKLSEAVTDRLLSEAGLVLDGDVPWTKAVLLSRFTIKSGKEMVAIVYDEKGRACEMCAPASYCEKIEVGSPIRVRLGEREGRKTLVMADKREGAPWDLLPLRVGVVSASRSDMRDGFRVVIAQGCEAVLSCKKEGEFGQGDLVEVRVSSRDGMWRAYSCRKLEKADNDMPGFCRRYKGVLRLVGNGDFAFVDDVFVPPDLVLSLGDIVDPQGIVDGLAVYVKKPGKDELGWKAVTATVVL